MLPEISRRCLSCGAAVRGGARFCHQCGAEMGAEEVATPNGEARAEVEEGGAPDAAAGAAAVESAAAAVESSAAGDEIRLEESWRRWKESVIEHAGAKEGHAGSGGGGEASRGESREVVAGAEPRGAVEERGVFEEKYVVEEGKYAGEEVAAPSLPHESAPPPPVVPPPSPLSPTPVAAREESDGPKDGRSMVGGADGFEGSLARPRSAERGGRAAVLKESLRPRVERVRDASRGVLEDAAEDSGLRFVLIAVALFVVFLLFLFINNLVG